MTASGSGIQGSTGWSPIVPFQQQAALARVSGWGSASGTGGMRTSRVLIQRGFPPGQDQQSRSLELRS